MLEIVSLIIKLSMTIMKMGTIVLITAAKGFEILSVLIETNTFGTSTSFVPLGGRYVRPCCAEIFTGRH